MGLRVITYLAVSAEALFAQTCGVPTQTMIDSEMKSHTFYNEKSLVINVNQYVAKKFK